MPTYDYRCNACSHEWEATHGMFEPTLTLCPDCGAEEAQRQVASAAILYTEGDYLLGKRSYAGRRT